MATVGGNLLQRTRCTYFYDNDGRAATSATPGQGCDAIDGFNRIHAILGASPACVATHPSDMCVALAALDAVVHLRERGRRAHAAADRPAPAARGPSRIETVLEPGELITAVELPPSTFAAHSTYRKVRDRASYAFALVSVAAALELDGDAVTRRAPRARRRRAQAVARLAGRSGAPRPTGDARRASALRPRPSSPTPRPLRDNGFKIELATRTIVAVLQRADRGGPAA